MPTYYDKILITKSPLVAQEAVAPVQTIQAGAVVVFMGTVREMTNGRRTVRLEYEAYESMAREQIHKLIIECRKHWPVLRASVHHRIGALELGDTAVIVAVSTPHRRDAFEAAQFLMDQLKIVVPIWKKEEWDDGSKSWIHPGLPESNDNQISSVTDTQIIDLTATVQAYANSPTLTNGTAQ
jgi:molybdopterin synthase catalytic subunit